MRGSPLGRGSGELSQANLYTPWSMGNSCVLEEGQFSTTSPVPFFSSSFQEGTESRPASSLSSQTHVWRMWPHSCRYLKHYEWFSWRVPPGLEGEHLVLSTGRLSLSILRTQRLTSPRVSDPRGREPSRSFILFMTLPLKSHSITPVALYYLEGSY